MHYDELTKKIKSNYHKLFETVHGAIFVVDKKTQRILDANTTAQKMYGYTLKEFLKKTKPQISAEKEQTRKSVRQEATFIPLRYHRRKNGEVFPVEISQNTLQIGELEVLIASIRDISERIEAEKNLKQSDEMNRTLFENIPVSTVVVDKLGHIIKFNRAKKTASGRLPKIGQIMYRDYANKHQINMYFELLDAMENNKLKKFPEMKYLKKYLSIKIAPFSMGAIITSQDITKQIKDRERMKSLIIKMNKSKNEWETTVDSLPHIIFLLDKKNRIIKANREIEKWKLSSIEKAKNKCIHHILHPRCRKKDCLLKNFFSQYLKDKHEKNYSDLEYYDKKLQKHLSIQLRPIAYPSENNEKNYAIGIIYDITQNKRWADRIIHLYRHLGVINRKVAILLNLQENQHHQSREKIFEFITKSALELSHAKVAILFGFDKKNNKLRSLSSSGNHNIEKPDKLKIFSPDSLSFFKKFIREKIRMQLTHNECDAKKLGLNEAVKYFLLLPIIVADDLKGILMIGSTHGETLSTQELNFYDIFAIHTSIMLKDMNL